MTISDKQLEANRKNAKLGGVKTEEGKAVSRLNALKHGVRIEYAAATRAGAHAQYPFWLSHLLIHLTQNRSHLFGDGAHHHQQIRLSRGERKPFRSKSRQVVVGTHRRHEFNSAT